jgi:hypothetical protein
MEVSVTTKEKLEALQTIYEESVYNLILEEAKERNPYKKGYILQDHYQIGKVTDIIIKVNVRRQTYMIQYKCDRLNKAMKPYRGGEITTIFLQNVEKVL